MPLKLIYPVRKLQKILQNLQRNLLPLRAKWILMMTTLRLTLLTIRRKLIATVSRQNLRQMLRMKSWKITPTKFVNASSILAKVTMMSVGLKKKLYVKAKSLSALLKRLWKKTKS